MTTRVGKLHDVLYVTWDRYDFLMEELAQRVRDLKMPKLRYVYGIPRGGVVVAACMSHKLHLKYVGDECWDAGLVDPGNTLVVDDICDTGEALEPFDGWSTATLFVRNTLPTSKRPTTFCTEVEPNLHVHFPYESVETTY